MDQWREEVSIDSTVSEAANSEGGYETEYEWHDRGAEIPEELHKDFHQKLSACVTPAPAAEEDAPIRKGDPMMEGQAVTFQEMCRTHTWMSPLEQQAYWGNCMTQVFVPVPVPVPIPVLAQQASSSSVAAFAYVNSKNKHRARSRSKVPASGPPTRGNGHQGRLAGGMPASDEEAWGREISVGQLIAQRLQDLQNLQDLDVYKKNRDLKRGVRAQTPDPYDRSLSEENWATELDQCGAFHRRVQALREMGYDKIRAAETWIRVSSKQGLSEEQAWDRVIAQLGRRTG